MTHPTSSRFAAPGLGLTLAYAGALCLAACAVSAVSTADPRDKSASSPAKPRRDWTAHPAVIEIDTAEDVFALGDPHGDYERTVALLSAAKLIRETPAAPETVRWSGGKAVLVCTGDLINKWDRGVDVLLLMRALAADAEKVGGRVIVLCGNHEAEFLATRGDSRKAVEFAKELDGRGIRIADVAAGKDSLGLGAYLRSLPFAARVNDAFFAHAGHTRGRTVKALSAELREGIDADGWGAAVLSDEDSLVEARLHPQPWWEKPRDKGDAGERYLLHGLKELGCRHLVIGHQPGKVKFGDRSVRNAGEMYARPDGSVFLIDCGLSRGVGMSDGGAVLRLRRKTHKGRTETHAVRIAPDGTESPLWNG